MRKLTFLFFIACWSNLHAQHPDLLCVKANTEGLFPNVTALVPSLFVFDYDGGNNNIGDGGFDMYDGGNYLNTNLDQEINYTHGQILNHPAFGSGGKYITMELSGLFVMAADLNNVSDFYITGNNGADGAGSTDTYDFQITSSAMTFNVYVKRVYGTSDPSINHMIIIPATPGVTHNASTNTNDDFDEITGINSVDRIYYILYASSTGGFINNATTEAIAQEFLDMVNTGTESILAMEDVTGNYCANNFISLAYDFCGTTFNPGNVFSLQLSDINGSFSSPTVIGTLTSVSPGAINGTLPSTLAAGYGYKLRLVSSNPVKTGVATGPFGIRSQPQLTDITICPGDTAYLFEPGNQLLYWYDSPSANIPLAVTTSYAVSPAGTETYYAAFGVQSYVIDSLNTSISSYVDHNALSGDDRGGVVVGQNHVYIVGDDNTVRYDITNLVGGVSLPVRDGLIGDYLSGNIYELYDVSVMDEIYNYGFPYTINALIRLDADLAFTTDTIHLSHPIQVDYASYTPNGVYSGPGFGLIYSELEGKWFQIDYATGQVTVEIAPAPAHYWSENWASWGFAEVNALGHTVAMYPYEYSPDIVRQSLHTGGITILHSFNDISDMASIAFSPTQNRIYWHHEGSSDLGTGSELAGYIGAPYSTQMVAQDIACRSEVTVTIGCATIEEHEVTSVIYPNPATESFFIRTEGFSGEALLQITDMYGRIIHYAPVMLYGDVPFPVNISNYAPGIYAVTLSIEGKVKNQLLIKQ